MSFQAKFSVAGSSVARPVVVDSPVPGTLKISPAEGAEGDVIEVAVADCEFRPPLGRVRRVIDLPGGDILESDDLAAVDALGATRRTGGRQRLVHHIESRWQWVLASIPVVIATVWLVYRFAIPIMAESIAFKLPASTLESASDSSIKLMDRIMFDETQIDEDRQSEIREGFRDIVEAIGTDQYNYHLHFRSMGDDVPNAMALPSGDIFITDGLIETAESDEEIFAVLAHELTHVERRHGMRMVLQDSGVFFLTAVMLGDVASAGALVSAAPAVLANSGYSRDFENEADEGAALYCIECGWTTKPMQRILERIAPASDSKVIGWISSHPDTAERVRRLMEIQSAHGSLGGGGGDEGDGDEGDGDEADGDDSEVDSEVDGDTSETER